MNHLRNLQIINVNKNGCCGSPPWTVTINKYIECLCALSDPAFLYTSAVVTARMGLKRWAEPFMSEYCTVCSQYSNVLIYIMIFY